MIARLHAKVAKSGPLRRKRRLSSLYQRPIVPAATNGALGARCLCLERRFLKVVASTPSLT